MWFLFLETHCLALLSVHLFAKTIAVLFEQANALLHAGLLL